MAATSGNVLLAEGRGRPLTNIQAGWTTAQWADRRAAD
jgi:hypothetical protein